MACSSCYQIGFIMNYVDCTVTEVIDVYFHGYWCVKVKFITYGIESETVLTFKTKEEAKKVKVGTSFLG